MKLIIDVDEDFYKKCTNYVTVDKFFPTIHQVDTALSSIGNGIPLDDIKAEIKETMRSRAYPNWAANCERTKGLDMALRIIDKHIRGAI